MSTPDMLFYLSYATDTLVALTRHKKRDVIKITVPITP